jgi:TatD DNase family protein
MSTFTSFKGVDFHCHLDLYPNHVEAIAKAEAACVYTLSVTTTPKAWPRNRALTESTHYVRAALGLHPQLIAERANELPIWERYLCETRYIGEVGLDAGPRFYRSLESQKHVFKTVLECCADAGGKILTVHSVRSANAVLDLIEAHLPPSRGRVVLHWFTGSRSEALRGVSLGCYFSINAEMALSERGQALIKALPIDRLLTETDGPFTKSNSVPSHPSDVGIAVDAIARIRNTTSDNIASSISTNLKTLLRTGD